MAFDAITETVAHFIGLFELAVEEARMRLEYDAFRAARDEPVDPEELVPVTVKVSAPYELKDFVPKLPKLDWSEAVAGTEGAAIAPLAFFGVIPEFPWPEPLREPAPFIVPHGKQVAAVELTLEPPGSVAVVIYQSNFLQDNDFVVFGEGADFLPVADFAAAAQALAEFAGAVAAFDIAPPPDGQGGGLDYAMAVADQMKDAADPGIEGLTVTVLKGGAAHGLHVNGAEAEEMPKFDDLLPAWLQRDEPEEDEGPGPLDGLGRDEGPGSGYDVAPGVAVVSGGNLVVNEVHLASNWLDAPVIAVAGNVVDLMAISQVNVLSDRDSGALPGSAPSKAVNAAAMGIEASAPADSGAAEGPPELPENWVVTRIEADLVAVNWIQQINVVTDLDCAQIEQSGWDTYLALGDNTVVNAAVLAEIGYGYDLIVIGGNMISVSMIAQTNMLYDNDILTLADGAEGAWSGADNMLLNSAEISRVGEDSYQEMTAPFAEATAAFQDGASDLSEAAAKDAVFEGVDLLRVLYIDGDFTKLNLFEQTNIVGDADQVQVVLDQLREQHGAELSVVAGSNALANIAAVKEFGTDSKVMHGGEVYSDALLYQAELIDTDAAPLGVGMNGLTNEAVAFLAEGMIETAREKAMDEALDPSSVTDGSTSPDVMQTMLA